MADYRLTNGHTVTTTHDGSGPRILTTFETKNPAGEVISNITRQGNEAAELIRDLCIANALAVGFYGMAAAGS